MTAVTDQDHTDHTDRTGNADQEGKENPGHESHQTPQSHREHQEHQEREDRQRHQDEREVQECTESAGPEGKRPEDEGGLSDEADASPQEPTGHARAADSTKDALPRPDADPAPDPSTRAAFARMSRADAEEGSADAWDDGLIARRVDEAAAEQAAADKAARTGGGGSALPSTPLVYDAPLRSRLEALRELVGLSRTRLDSRTLAQAGRVLDEAAARRRHSGQHTVVALAGATGSGKSQLFNALAGVTISETGVRRPTTSSPIVCSWSDGASSLIDRLGIPGRLRRRPVQSAEAEAQLRGLVLIDLPDHDSAAVQHREQVDRVLALVDAVIWVVDPEKYADAVLHERYLRPMAGHAEVMFVVLNQVDRLPGEAAELVLDDLRRLLDEDGVALGEYGEPGATVLALSALTGDGVGELREALGQFVAERGAAARRIGADVDAAARRLRSVYATGRRIGLSEQARDEFADRLADAVGATAAGEAAERAWLRNANRACGTPWLRLWRWHQDRREPPTGRLPVRAQADEEATARQRVEQAVRTVSERASAGLPVPWAQAVREAAVRGAQGLPEALDDLAARAGLPPGRPPRPGWWPVAVLAQASMTLLQVVGGLWLVGQIVGVMAPNLGVPVLLMVSGIIGGPLVEWSCRMAARGPARRYGHDAERRLREAAAGCGRARVLDPVAAELLRYREVREQYARVTGAAAGAG
ncbi:YfjP family GTPase [Streptomyces sp. ID05-04B]|uniref:YfjP family GTPase n=1 Tax=unclassified Streptomyces TaxID=2593676 RepID=UPI0020B1459A|nr:MULTISPECIES: YfjP family GTPase [unclassified Streptomyces]MDX5566339.1 YfjP family GTPase [Streptomyces sp. ID05-04B]